jgi:ABC-type lipoprotein release transport system permease subunit
LIRNSLQLVAKRTLAHKRLLFAVISGVFLAVTILSGSVVYTNALKDLAVQDALRPLDGSDVDLLITADFGPIDETSIQVLQQTVASQIDPTVAGFGEFLGFAGRSETFLVAGDVGLGEGNAPPDPNNNRRAWLATAGAFVQHVDVVSGSMPPEHQLGDVPIVGEPDVVLIPAIVSEQGLAQLQAEVGDTFLIYPTWLSARESITVRIDGVYRRSEPDSEFWRLYDEGLKDQSKIIQSIGLLTDDNAFTDISSRSLTRMQGSFGWLYGMEFESLTPTQGRDLVNRLSAADRSLSARLDNYSQKTELPNLIGEVTRSVGINTVPMTVVMILVVIVVLYYVSVLGLLLVEAQATEIGLLTSRGATSMQVLVVYVIETAALSVVAAIAAPFIALGAVSLIGVLPWFTDLNGGDPLPVRLTASTFQMAGIGGILILLALFIPALKAARSGLVNYLRSLARPPAINLIQRYYLDLVFLAVVVYLFSQLSSKGSFVANDLLGETKVDELILAVPALVMLAVAVVVVRLFPLSMGLLAHLASMPGVSRVTPSALVLGLWEMARNPAHHARFSLLLMLTAGLGVFASSFNSTLERNVEERILYETGADVRMTNLRPLYEGPSTSVKSEADANSAVEASSMVMRNLASALDVQRANTFSFLAVNTDEISDVGWLRDDFDIKPDGDLLAQIAGNGFPGLAIPPDTESLIVRIRPSRIPSGISLVAIRARDANGRYFTIDAGIFAGNQLGGGGSAVVRSFEGRICTTAAGEWCDMTSPLVGTSGEFEGEFEPVQPVEILSMGIARSSRFRFGGSLDPAAVDFDSITAVNSAGGRTVLEAFDDVSNWHVIRTSPASSGDVLSTVEANGQTDSGVARFTYTRITSQEFRGIAFGEDPGPAPVLINDAFLDVYKMDVGDRTTVSFGLVPIDVRITDSIDLFPTLDPEVRPFLIADLDYVLWRTNTSQIATEIFPNEIWISSTATSDEIAETLPIQFYLPNDRAEQLDAVALDPLLTAGWRALLGVSFFTVMAVSAIGFLVHSQVTFSSRSRDFALLRTVGLSMKQLLGIVVLEHAVVIGVSVSVGALAGARLGSTIMPYLANSGEGVEVTPPMILIIDWGNFALAFGILGAVLAAVITAISLAVYRMSIHSAMRMGD